MRLPSSTSSTARRVVVEDDVVAVERAGVLGSSGSSASPSVDNALPYDECEWAAATTSPAEGRGA